MEKEYSLEYSRSKWKLAHELMMQWCVYTPQARNTREYLVELVLETINKATQREREVKETLCKQLEFTITFLKINLDTATSRKLIEDIQELVDQVRLER